MFKQKLHKLEIHTKVVRPTKYDALEQRQFQHKDKEHKKSRKPKKLKDQNEQENNLKDTGCHKFAVNKKKIWILL